MAHTGRRATLDYFDLRWRSQVTKRWGRFPKLRCPSAEWVMERRRNQQEGDVGNQGRRIWIWNKHSLNCLQIVSRKLLNVCVVAAGLQRVWLVAHKVDFVHSVWMLCKGGGWLLKCPPGSPLALNWRDTVSVCVCVCTAVPFPPCFLHIYSDVEARFH